jgi:hypothetical protein
MNEKELKKILERIKDQEKRICALENGEPIGKSNISSSSSDMESPKDLVLSIVNKISGCDEGEEIQNKVLDQKNMGAKILLCFYISYKYFKNAWLTTGDIEKITSSLGAKIAVGNVSNKIKEEIWKYLESGSVRKKGQPTPYRLNRKGAKYFEEIIHARVN